MGQSSKTQQAIIEEVKRISYHVSPRIWLAIKWLCTYISIRPAELRNIKEGDIDRKQGFLFIPHPKEKRPKLVPLVDEDIEILNTIPAGLPDLYFFRYTSLYHGTPGGSRFGLHLFYKWWRRACNNLGVQGVDLYGGTRHSSAVALRHHATPEQIRRATMHSTNKAFERYFQVSKDELVSLYSLTNRPTNDQPKRKAKKDLTG
jgi:integrase